MKYEELNHEKRERLNAFLSRQTSEQAARGRQVFEEVSKAVLYANTGGIAVAVSFFASAPDSAHVPLLMIALILFVLGVIAFIGVKFRLAHAIADSAATVKQIHLDVVEGRQEVEDEAINRRLGEIGGHLEGSEPIWAIKIPISLFVAGAVLGCGSLIIGYMVT